MKKIVIILILILALVPLFSHTEVRIGFEVATDWNSGESYKFFWEDEAVNFNGIQIEVLGHHLGVGVDSLVDFSQDKNENWAVDWQGLLFLRYHFFGSRSFIDPFIEAGFGNAGSVIMNVPEEEQELKLVLYPSLSAGVNMVLHEAFYLGGRFSYRPDHAPIPGTDIPQMELSDFQTTFYVGFALGHY